MVHMYAVYEHQEKGRATMPRYPDDAYVLVREGFSWPAALFGPLWALANGMWIVAALLVATLAGIAYLPEIALGSEDLQPYLSVLFAAILGLLGSDLREWSLQRSGHQLAGVVSGTNLVDAERRLFASMGSLLFGG